ncbi:MAG: hypothetical protein E7456_02770 [Ruminococcaceae bacterium]|nr:hypothetical protein [Oscillospiraceae bacterium]
MSLNSKMTAIADAIRSKTGITETLTLDRMATEIAGIETEPVLEALTITENGTYVPPVGVDGFSQVVANVAASGGSMEHGELTTTTANYYKITIPVSSKKSHIVVYPKVFDDETHNTGRISYWLVVEGYTQIEIRPRGSGTYMRANTDMSTTFNDTSIVFDGGKAPYNVGEYYWFAW